MRHRASRREWSRRVSAWRRSGKTSKEFAAETGVNASTLLWWSTKLGGGSRGARKAWGSRRTEGRIALDGLAQLPIVELSSGGVDNRFELELGAGRRLRIPPGFDAGALQRLLAVLE